MRRLLNQKWKRSVHLLFVPDEELGGFEGMVKFIEHARFKALNAGLFIDEGIANPADEMTVISSPNF